MDLDPRDIVSCHYLSSLEHLRGIARTAQIAVADEESSASEWYATGALTDDEAHLVLRRLRREADEVLDALRAGRATREDYHAARARADAVEEWMVTGCHRAGTLDGDRFTTSR